MDLASYKVWVNGRYAYYPVQKAASSSLQLAFRGEPVDMRNVPKGILKFTWIRNPFDRLASLYAQNRDYPPLRHSGMYKDMPFDEFILKVSETTEPLCDKHLWSASHTTPVDCRVFYFEDFEHELHRLSMFLGREINLRHINKTRYRKPKYTPELEALVASRYCKDLTRFYENNTDIKGCRAGGKAEAKVRQGFSP